MVVRPPPPEQPPELQEHELFETVLLRTVNVPLSM
jgi:hypothetical protein